MISRNIVSFIVLFITINTYSQVSYQLGPQCSYGSNHYFVKPFFKESISYIPSIDSEIGINLGIEIKDRVLIETGINLNAEELVRENSWILNGAQDPNDVTDPLSYLIQKKYIQIPFNFGYVININERFSMVPKIGISTLFLIHAAEVATYYDGSKVRSVIPDNAIKNCLIDSYLRLLFEYKIKKNWAIGIEPYIGKRLSKPDIPELQTGALSYGLSVKVNYKINAL